MHTHIWKTRNGIVYVHIMVRASRPARGMLNGFFRVFEGLFLEAPRVVRFHATAMHCHNGMDTDDTSLFILGSELQVCSKFKFPVNQRRSRNAEVS